MQKNNIKLALPAGSLKEATLSLFKRAGFKIEVGERSYSPRINDTEIECRLIRAQEIPRYVEQGKFDMGITGKDWIEENNADVSEIADLIYSKGGMNSVKFVIAVPKDSKIKTIKDLGGKTITTELVEVTKKFLAKNKVKANVEFSWGATESKPPYLADAIAELTDSGASLRANNLRVIDTILESTTKIIANKKSITDSWKREKIESIAMLLKSAYDADKMVGIKLNIRKNKLEEVIKTLPALRNPTISLLTEDGWYSVESIVDETTVKAILPKLKKIGAEGIIEYPINKIIY